MVILLLIVVGLCLGSFVNALIWRLHAQAEITEQVTQTKKKLSKSNRERMERLSITKGRSMCLSCDHELAAKDLVPVISWLALRGKCRYCAAPIADTPVAELLVPASFVLSYLCWPWLISDWGLVAFLAWLAALTAFVALTLYDLRWSLLPFRIVYPLIGVAVVFRTAIALQTGAGWLQVALAGFWGVLLLAGLFWLLFTVSHETWMGGGDVNLAIALGLFAGGPLGVCLLLFIASVGGSLAAVPLLVRRQPLRHVRIPFGPFLLAATLIAVLFGQSIIDWYTGLLVL